MILLIGSAAAFNQDSPAIESDMLANDPSSGFSVKFNKTLNFLIGGAANNDNNVRESASVAKIAPLSWTFKYAPFLNGRYFSKLKVHNSKAIVAPIVSTGFVVAASITLFRVKSPFIIKLEILNKRAEKIIN